MQMTLTFPTRDGDLLAALKSYSGKISASTGSYEVTVAEAADLATLVASYESALLACDPTTRSQSLVFVKNQARNLARDFAYNLGMAIAVRPSVSEALKLDLNIRARKPNTRHGRPTQRPMVGFVSASNRTVVVSIHDSVTGEKTSRLSGIVSALVYTYVGEDYPTDPSLWQFAGPAPVHRNPSLTRPVHRSPSLTRPVHRSPSLTRPARW
ncbi:MAG TPA: hypothetical protein VGN72_00780 [Tepidisphaeraceae bacterium]|jgi:hypothetical protein|nr:hypothetical protein [Tepidisphaeraceae bacterium]